MCSDSKENPSSRSLADAVTANREEIYDTAAQPGETTDGPFDDGEDPCAEDDCDDAEVEDDTTVHIVHDGDGHTIISDDEFEKRSLEAQGRNIRVVPAVLVELSLAGLVAAMSLLDKSPLLDKDGGLTRGLRNSFVGLIGDIAESVAALPEDAVNVEPIVHVTLNPKQLFALALALSEGTLAEDGEVAKELAHILLDSHIRIDRSRGRPSCEEAEDNTANMEAYIRIAESGQNPFNAFSVDPARITDVVKDDALTELLNAVFGLPVDEVVRVQ